MKLNKTEQRIVEMCKNGLPFQGKRIACIDRFSHGMRFVEARNKLIRAGVLEYTDGNGGLIVWLKEGQNG